MLATKVQAESQIDNSAPFEMSVENALKVLSIAGGALFDDILRAKKSILATCKDDQEAIAGVLISNMFSSFLLLI
ncbi:CHAPERONE-LIKE PROTEIN OF POR1, chloroplastic [Olea europaea subsp. europaea]|uniref:CHAPERONE-LIKE PROTEIN OF POR1, chloroplastic n=1 Tax=Olea europaea subsp. europaea TaxID=158383 RepID=A0A8S0TKG7_OLEEU|nr:CHAPERONE-LIKE PROTEIN OF POR1, chloroplastic [Olea europaea subsp. europaea]